MGIHVSCIAFSINRLDYFNLLAAAF